MSWIRLIILGGVACLVYGHGRVLEPAGRGSAWRIGYPTKPNYDDDGLNCGGFSHQWSFNDGNCGICGDPYDWPSPRPHELGGIYGQGVIVANYQPGSVFTVSVDLTASHRGFWEFRLCPDPQSNDESCFEKYLLELEEGGTQYRPEDSRKYSVNYRLPAGLVCDHCVLQWKYTAGNNWGVCANGTQGLGCGNQEQFRACSDISIMVSRNYDVREKVPEGYEEIPYPLFFYLRHGYFDLEQGFRNAIRKGVRSPRRDKKHKKKHRKHRKSKKHRKKMSPQKNKKMQLWNKYL